MIASIRHAKAHFSELVNAAVRGEEILITSHGRTVARLSAVVRGEDKPGLEIVMQELAEEGVLDAPESPRRVRRLPACVRLKGGETIAQTVADMRR